MTSTAPTPEAYIAALPKDRKEAVIQLRETILTHLPNGFEEGMQYGMIGYFVPHSRYPDGYHCNPKEPLPFLCFASQKNSINIYHSGLYANKKIYDWFVAEYPKHVKTKLDMGKSCIRFKKLETIPYALIAALCGKMTVADWIALYEKNIKNRGRGQRRNKQDQ